MSKTFSQALLQWFDLHGRKNLPWQHPITPYRVWVSEIMLQQTQVDTVIPYFERFMQQYPQLKDLAEAPIDKVLHLWTGLGYYARARNLHRCAQVLTSEYGGKFPQDVEKLVDLPGIGPSTAAAIASIAFDKATAILDGNVKRVLARYHGVAGWPGVSGVEKQLWQHARTHMPQQRCRDYTQAIMDLGATLCRRSRPDCDHCPLQVNCHARERGSPQDFPGKKPRKTLPIKSVQMLIICNDHGDILLEKRPPSGIWGGLWSLPELDLDIDPFDYVSRCYGAVKNRHPLALLRHTFSHYHLDIHPVVLTLHTSPTQHLDAEQQRWYSTHAPLQIGLATPVKKLIHQSAAALA